jgi:hypothetical protein
MSCLFFRSLLVVLGLLWGAGAAGRVHMPAPDCGQFLLDITVGTGAESLSSNVGKLTVGHVEAWEVLIGRPNIRREMRYLNKIMSMRNNSKIRDNLTLGADTYDDFLKKITNNHGQFSGVKFNNSVEFMGYLNALETLINNYDGILGFKASLPPLKTATRNGFDGVWFGIQQMNTIPASSVSKVDLEFDENLDCGTLARPAACKYDLEMIGDKPRYYEFKSYGEASIPKFSQLKAYFSRIKSISELEYVFEGRKAGSESNVKLKFQNFLCADCSDSSVPNKSLSLKGEELFNAIWNNAALRGSLFENDGIDFAQPDNVIRPIGVAKFQEKVKTITHSFYNFIKIK